MLQNRQGCEKYRGFCELRSKAGSQKIEFIRVKDNIDTSSYMGRAMLYIVAIFAEIERRQIADRVRDGMLHIATKGRNLGIPPFGFDTYDNKNTGRWSLVKRQKNSIKKIFLLNLTNDFKSF